MPPRSDDSAMLDTRAYNAFGQLVQANRDGLRVEYVYRPDGLRYQKTVTDAHWNKTSAVYVWDGMNLVLETNGETNVTKAKYLRGDGLICQLIDSSTFYYLFNQHGDVVQRADQSGNLSTLYDYDAFGNNTRRYNVGYQPTDGLDTDPNPFRYCGEYFDAELGEIYLRARSYCPASGRFTCEDPIRSGGNWYGYCDGNPVRFKDPMGLLKSGKDYYNNGKARGKVESSGGGNSTTGGYKDPGAAIKDDVIYGGMTVEQAVIAQAGGGSPPASSPNTCIEYNREQAVDYIHNHTMHGSDNFIWNFILSYIFDRNSQYRSYSANCANLVSQALFAGGVPMNREWYHYFLLQPTLGGNISEWRVGEPWRLASAQFNYFSDPANGYINGDVITIVANNSNLDSQLRGLAAMGVQPGDLLYWETLDENSNPAVTHATMIDSVSAEGVTYAGNSRTRQMQQLDESFTRDSGHIAIHIVRLNDHF